MRRVMLAAAVTLAAMGAGPAAAGAADSPATVDRVTVTSVDGVRLGGWLLRPGEATKPLGTVLISSPYLGQCVKLQSFTFGPCWPTPERPEDWDQHPEPVRHLVEQGYAVAWFSVRGTGVSGGCFDDMGPREQRDQKVLVDWIAAQPWSNGRVAAMGLSYMSATALAAAVERPKALKTVIVGGVVSDLYAYAHSTQGLSTSLGLAGSEAVYVTDVSGVPAGALNGDPDLLAERAPFYSERLCPEVLREMTEGSKGAATGARDARFWLDRRLDDRFDVIRASVLVAHGLQERQGHRRMEDALWSKLPGEKAMWLGQWGHVWPWQVGVTLDPPPAAEVGEAWLETLEAWLHHELRGGPKPRGLGRVRFEDDGGEWRTAKAWPPPESSDEALYLQPAGTMAGGPAPLPGGTGFRAATMPESEAGPQVFLCPDATRPGGAGSAVFTSAPVAKRTVVAGNPMAYLDLAADQPGGGVQATLFDLGPDFACSGSGVTGARELAFGGADLRFHHGGFDARPFGGGHVRIDLTNLATVLEPGHRLALTLSGPALNEFAEPTHAPEVTAKHGPRPDASQLVVPVLEGGFGGSAPKVAFPPRPDAG